MHDLAQTDRILRLLRREVWIVTAAANGKRGGLLATWVSAASIDSERPVMLAGIAPNHFTAELIDASQTLAFHILRPDQIELAWNFTRDSGRERDKFSGLEVALAATGAPILTDCLAWLDCRVIGRHDAGDRLFFWADVVASREVSAGSPLTDQALMAALSADQRQRLFDGRNADIAIHRPLHAAWRQE